MGTGANIQEREQIDGNGTCVCSGNELEASNLSCTAMWHVTGTVHTC